MERILAFGCHPDDVELQCAGTLALLAQAGCEIHIAVLAGGEMGAANLPPREIRARRFEEARAAAAVLGATLHWAGGYDLEIEYRADLRRRTVQVVREVDPGIILTHPPQDYLIDHEEASRLVRNAAFAASIPNYDDGHPSKIASRIPHLYYWEAVGGTDIFGRRLPLTCTVDIGSVLELKTRMLACHASQREWLRRVVGWDEYLERMRQTAETAGRAAGVRWGEGFVQHLGLGHPKDNALRRILGSACLETPPSEPPAAGKGADQRLG